MSQGEKCAAIFLGQLSERYLTKEDLQYIEEILFDCTVEKLSGVYDENSTNFRNYN